MRLSRSEKCGTGHAHGDRQMQQARVSAVEMATLKQQIDQPWHIEKLANWNLRYARQRLKIAFSSNKNQYLVVRMTFSQMSVQRFDCAGGNVAATFIRKRTNDNKALVPSLPTRGQSREMQSVRRRELNVERPYDAPCGPIVRIVVGVYWIAMHNLRRFRRQSLVVHDNAPRRYFPDQ